MDRKKLREAMQHVADEAVAPREIQVPKWGKVYVRDVTVAEVDSDTDEDQSGGKQMRLARAACRVICDEKGERIFDAKNPDDLALLAAQPWSLLQKVLAKADSTGNA